MDWYRTANGREQQYFPFYNPSEPVTPQLPQNKWPDPSEDPIKALNEVVDYHFAEIDQFLASHSNIYDVQLISFNDTNSEQKADPVRVIDTSAGKYVLDEEYLNEAEEWIQNVPDYLLGNYVGYKDFNEEFWEFPPGVMYHGTSEENLPNIMEHGLDLMSGPRAISNRNVGSAIFTSPDPDIARYHYPAVIEINVGAMNSDGYKPRASQEDPFEDDNMRSALASKIGLDEWVGEEYSGEGLADDTIVFFDPIPVKYLTIYHDPREAEIQGQYKFAGDKVDETLENIWDAMKALAKKHNVSMMWGGFADVPEIVELWDKYQEIAKQHGKRPLGTSSPNGGWAMSWVKGNCKFADRDYDNAYDPYREKVENVSQDNPYPFRAWFDQNGRTYIPFQGNPEEQLEDGGIDQDVAGVLSDSGCQVSDYQGGYCQRGNRTLRIGRVLQQLKNKALQDVAQREQAGDVYDSEREKQEISQYYDDLIQTFTNSPYRASKSNRAQGGLQIVISQDPHDVASMSTGRNWTSCMELGEGGHYESVYCEVANGGLIAYLIREDDQDIRNPLARIHIRRFDNRQGQSIAVPEQSVYGDNVDGFEEVVRGWLNERQEDLSGIYQRQGGEYSDTFDDDMLVSPTNQEGIVGWLRGEHEDAKYSTWRVNDDMYEDTEDTYDRYGGENPVEDLSKVFKSKEEAEQYLEAISRSEQSDWERQEHRDGWDEIDEETGAYRSQRFELIEKSHDNRQKMKDLASEKILDAPSGTYDDTIMQEVKKHVWDGKIHSPLKNKLLKSRPDLLSEEDIDGLKDTDSLDYIMSLPPEQRKEHLASWQYSIERMLDEPEVLASMHIEDYLTRFRENPDSSSPVGRTWLDEATSGIVGATHDHILNPAQKLFNPIPEPVSQKIVKYINNVDEIFDAPISESRYFNHLLSGAINAFSTTDTDTPTIQRFYKDVLSRVKIPEVRGRSKGVPFETIGRSIAKLGENGTGFLPWIEENLVKETQRMEALKDVEQNGKAALPSSKKYVSVDWNYGIDNYRKTAEDNVEKLLYMQDSIVSGTGSSQKYKFYDDKRWTRAWVEGVCRFASKSKEDSGDEGAKISLRTVRCVGTK